LNQRAFKNINSKSKINISVGNNFNSSFGSGGLGRGINSSTITGGGGGLRGGNVNISNDRRRGSGCFDPHAVASTRASMQKHFVF
jgi:hypothetical protein